MYLPALSDFFSCVEKDDRITSTHISLYMALFEAWNKNDFINPVSITRKEIMLSAKITRTTYHRYIKELHDYSYIKYVPSYHPILGSLVYLNLFSSNISNHALLYTS